MKRFFWVDIFGSSRVVIYILGIRIRFIKPKYKNIFNDIQNSYSSISEIPRATGNLRKFQIASLKFLLQVDKICKENDIKYWLDHGNLLGSVRHGGYIPWDDDSDIGMMRKDYENFIKIFEENPNKYPDIYLTYDNNGKNKCFIKIKNKAFEEIAIDVFPYDFYYKKVNENEKDELNNKIKKLQRTKINLLLFPYYILSPTKMRKRFAKITKKTINLNNAIDETIHPAIYTAIDYPQRDYNLVYDYDTIFPLTTVNFEGFEFSAPNDIDKYLKQKYGNYMELPKDCYPRHIFLGNTNEIKLENFISDMEIN